MKKGLVILVLILFSSAIYATEESYIKRYNGYPKGTFKKSMSGKIIQYDTNGKKIGVYKIGTGKYKK